MKEVKETIIDYEGILSESPDTDIESIIQFLCEVLPDEWCEKYQEMTPSETNILQFNDNAHIPHIRPLILYN